MVFTLRLLRFAGLAILMLAQGCSYFRSPVSLPAEGMRAIRRDRLVHVTLLGSANLNPTADGRSRPVQACVYLVGRADWFPRGHWGDQERCRKSAGDDDVFDLQRQFVAADRAQRVELKMPSDSEGWLVIDADFARGESTEPLLRIRTGSAEYSVHLVVFEGVSVRDGHGSPDTVSRGRR